jgi:hypothetical protein
MTFFLRTFDGKASGSALKRSKQTPRLSAEKCQRHLPLDN